MATVESKLMTAEEFWEWAHRPENRGRSLELNRGEVVEMPPPGELHGVVCFLIAHLVGLYVFRRGKGYVCTNDTGLLVERDPDTLRGPDIMVFDETRRLADLNPNFATGIPRLIVEVLSPNDTYNKVSHRIHQYLKRGVPLVWLVDPSERTVGVFRPGGDYLLARDTDELSSDEVLPDFRCKVADLFAMPGQKS